MRTPKITLVTQWFPPEPAWQPLWIAHALQRSGFDPTVLTGVPNYPTGEVYPGYRAWRPRVDAVEGLLVRRTPLYPSHDTGALGRALNYVSWSLSATAIGARHLRKMDAALVYSSPGTSALPALLARVLFGVPYVMLVEDVWPDSVFSSGFLNGRGKRLVEWLLHRFMNLAYRRAHHVAVISPGMIDLLASRGVERSKLSLVYNWVADVPDAVEGGIDWRAQWGLGSEDFVFMYAGNHGGAQSLSAVIEAVGQLPLSERCHLVLIGDGMEKRSLEDLAERVAPGRVHFMAPQARDSMWGLMRAADVQLVALADRPIFSVTMPSKLPTIMAAGHPVFAVASGDVARVVDEAACGVTATPGDVHSIRRALLVMRHATKAERAFMGDRGRAYYDEEMSMSAGSRRLCTIMANAVEEDVS